MPFSIKQSFANCFSCPLLDCDSCILETNCEDDLSKVDVVFVAENPGKDEVYKGFPLVGKTGQDFRKYFRKYNLHKTNYLLTNIVLCQTLNEDGTTGNPTEEVIERCKVNAFNIVKACNPKLVVIIGSSSMAAFGIAKTGITKLRGNFFEWEGYKLFLTIHPSFFNRQRIFESKFEDDMRVVAEFLTGKSIQSTNTINTKPVKHGIYRYSIPEKFYSEDYRLVDVQYMNQENEVLYIFRDKNDKKIFHKMDDSYYYYKPLDNNIEARKILPYDKVNCYITKYKLKSTLDPDICYENDIRICAKHAIDYYHFNKDEPDTKDLGVMFLDIEVYTGKEKEFPKPSEAKYPICLITTFYRDKVTTYVLDNGKEINTKRDDTKVVICKSEKDLLRNFINDLKDLDVDFLSGWNAIQFDLEYIYNRCKKLYINPNTLSKTNGNVYVEGSRYQCDIPGVVVLDQKFLYESFSFERKESYSLAYISNLELDETKLEIPQGLNWAYENDINTLIDYNLRDVMLLVKLETKLKHITLLNELRKICNSSFSGSSSPMGRLDSLMVSFLKNKNLCSKCANPNEKGKKFEGAFVKEPIKGIHNWIVDFDFTSLYPSIIQTYNIGINTFVFKLEDHQMGYDFVYDIDNFPEKVNIILDPMYSAKKMTITKEQLLDKIKEENLTHTITGCFFKNHDKELSYYAEMLENLLSSRKVFKKKMFKAEQAGNKFEEDLFNTKQLVYKTLSNALYGILGNSAFRFFNVDCARSITLSGQEATKTCIMEAQSYVEKLRSGKYMKPNMLSKKEMYEDLSRKTKYIITSDTDSLFVTYEKLLKDNEDDEVKLNKVKKWNNEIQEFLNKEIVENIVKNHNVNLEKNRLILKNELVIKRGLYLAKKRYANYVLLKEGNEQNKIDAKGLETRRSDFGKYTKDSLNELLDIILKSEKVSIIEIQKFVKDREIDILRKIREGRKEIARPSAWTKKLKEYKVIPQGVHAMMAWNKLMYETFGPGSKGYLFKIKGIDQFKAPKEFIEKYNKEFLSKGKKIEVIAIPAEEDKLPEWIIPDQKAILKFCWQDRYNLLLEPIVEVKDEILTF